MLENSKVNKVSNAGPVWMVESSCPDMQVMQSTRDNANNWTTSQAMQVAILRGKSAIAEARSRICVGVAECIFKLWGIEKGGKGTPRRVQTCWPDMKGAWRIVADGHNLVAGRTNMDTLCYDIEISEANAGGMDKAKALAHSVREGNLETEWGTC